MRKAFSHTVFFPKTVLLPLLIIIFFADLSAQCEHDTIPPTAVPVNKFELRKFKDAGIKMIDAKLFDNGFYNNGSIASFDNCTRSDELIFSFGYEQKQKSLDELEVLARSDAKFIEIFLSDGMSNLKSKVVELVPSYPYLSFRVENFIGNWEENYGYENPLNYIDLIIVDSKKDTIQKKDTIGNFWTQLSYGIDTVGHPLPYTVHYKLNNDHLFYDGLTTLDMVIIQKFIMKLSKIPSLCTRMRMDFNDDQNVTVSDLMVFRWIILNYAPGLFDIIQAYDPDLKKWKKYFPLHINELSDSIYSFVLLRKGDMNLTGFPNFYCNYEGDVADSLINHFLSNDTIDINVEERKISDDGIFELNYSNVGEKEINAYQISFVMDTTKVELINVMVGDNVIPDYYYTIINDTFLMTAIERKIKYHDEVFRAIIRAKDPVLNDIHHFIKYGLSDSRLEVTTDDFYSTPVRLHYKNLTKVKDPEMSDIFSIAPNPFDNELKIYLNEDLHFSSKIKIYDTFGKIIYSNNDLTRIMKNGEIVIPGSYFEKVGFILLQSKMINGGKVK
ncbi:MAG: hypothetical protein IPH57_03515 [Saprospiraceae bacterium]|nr:hypothetical protein [Saprospiraceae bacterium]